MNYQLRAACGCDPGRRRAGNEDNFYFDGACLPADSGGLEAVLTGTASLERWTAYGVFDGMGGHADGQTASALAAAFFRDACAAAPDALELPPFLADVTRWMTDAVWHRAQAEGSDMGTTEAVVCFDRGRFYLCNVGDSRIFRQRGGVLEQLSQDHTDEALLRRLGADRQPTLTQYIGVSPEELTVEPHLTAGPLEAGDQFLLCSDGLTDMVSDEVISQVLQKGAPPEEKVEELIYRALSAGGGDNVTVILVEVCPRESEPPAPEEEQAPAGGGAEQAEEGGPARQEAETPAAPPTDRSGLGIAILNGILIALIAALVAAAGALMSGLISV